MSLRHLAPTLVLALLAAPVHAGTPASAPAPAAKDTQGTDFGPQVKAMFRVAACGDDGAIPDKFSIKTIDAHCKELDAVYKSYKKAWADEAQKFIAELRPKDLTHTVIYPFGGGDLSSALAVYPDATELTTISLEAAGDVRAIDSIPKGKLASDLDEITLDLRRLYRAAHSTTKSLQQASHSTLPGTIMMALAGLAVHDMEPVALRYFEIEADGKLHYVTIYGGKSDIDLDRLDVQKTTDQNASRGVTFTLTPPDPAPAAPGPISPSRP